MIMTVIAEDIDIDEDFLNMNNNLTWPVALTNALRSGLETIDHPLPPDFLNWIDHYQQSLKNIENPHILLLEPNPLKFCAAAIAFLKKSEGSLFLGNPAWKIEELRQVAHLLNPDRLWSSPEITSQWSQINQNINHESRKSILHYKDETLIYFPTGGSSGGIRFAAHSLSTLTTAVTGLQQFIKSFLPPSGQINSFCVLPLFHVGGFMQWWRSALTEGQFCLMDYATVKNNPPRIPEDFVTSLVPTQLQYLLDNQPQFLKQFRVIFLGGAPAWPGLLTQARKLQLNLAPTYGMTETAGQVATLLPTDFLQGRSSVGKILPHVEMIMLEQQNLSSKRKASKSDDVRLINVISDALFLGYYPSLGNQIIFFTGDLGCFKQKYLHIVGRYNRRIISGGKNIDPLEIETWLLDQNLVKDIVIVGIDDRHWGEAVTAIYVPQDQVNQDQIIEALKTYFAPHKCPKHWLLVPEIRRSPLGKINYAGLQLWAKMEIDK